MQFQTGKPRLGSIENPQEKWFFINGIATGQTWLQNNLDRLAVTFRREIIGIQNPTKGVLFDLIECLIQRDLNYRTSDIRAGCIVLKEAVEDPQNQKVVLILHSQGGIEGAAIMDSLFDSVSEAALSKLEIYTFASAARHFNNPIRSFPSGIAIIKPPANGALSNKRSAAFSHSPDRLVRHIEHYANSGDFVSQIGVLKFSRRELRWASRMSPYYGKVFEREGTGHLLNQHYLDEMFSMKDGMVLENNNFMDSLVNPESTGDNGNVPMGTGPSPMVSVKSLSRLWKYRNGWSPID